MDSESRLPVDISHVLSRGTPGATTQVQNGVSGSYMEAVFEIVTHNYRVRDLDNSTTQGRLTTAPRLVKFMYTTAPLSVPR